MSEHEASDSGTQRSLAPLAPFVMARRTCFGVACHAGVPTATARLRSWSLWVAPAEVAFCRAAADLPVT